MRTNDQVEMIHRLTGVQSSKKSYYTELKKTVRELKKRNMQLEIINDVTKSFNIDMSMDEMLKNIFGKLNKIFSVKRISLFSYEEGNLTLSNVYPSHSTYFQKGYAPPKEHSIYWRAFESRNYLFYQINKKEEEILYVEKQALTELDIQCVLLLPLICKEKAIGLLSVGSQQVVQYDQSDITFFRQLGDQLAVCISNARLYNEAYTSKKEWEETFRAVSDMIFLVNIKGEIIRYNDAVTELMDLDKEGAPLDFHQVLKLERNESPFEEAILTRKPVHKQIHFNMRVCELHSYPVFNDQQELYSVIVYLNDITEKSQIEMHLLQSGKLAAIGEMAAGVAHELNNPLTAILGNAQLLLRNVKEEDRTFQLLKDIHQCGKRCKSIIQNLLTFSRQEEYLFQQCSVNEAVDQVLGLIGDQLKKQHIFLTKQLDPHLPLIDGSVQQIGQVILNLLINAKDALEECGRPKKEMIIRSFSCIEEGEKWVYLSVEDNGIGIHPHSLQEIFNPFFTMKSLGKGTGLGLSVSLGIAEAHGGTISVHSVLDEGSIFTLKIPIKAD
ncbi:two-component system NtrC family sensor kinase [Oikeobacillus pervagus]|uniref:histidine kinase n=1 Tax=Oikeobacillus pervagus TaxID=1325931 RepID=A0AAJ1SXI2_9BACI|nr:ATP-binding protein [Oikeobacillus pervagus]MDQ0214379.1 two-component system NtrC family sensor kinase [Oikeobacillus pervagus]